MIRTQSRSSTIYSDNDPLAIALRPPPFESDIERELRLKAEREAKEISDRIDEQIRLERESKKRANMQVKVSITRPGRRRLVLFVSPPPRAPYVTFSSFDACFTPFGAPLLPKHKGHFSRIIFGLKKLLEPVSSGGGR